MEDEVALKKEFEEHWFPNLIVPVVQTLLKTTFESLPKNMGKNFGMINYNPKMTEM